MENKKNTANRIKKFGTPQIGHMLKIEINGKCYTIQTEDTGLKQAKIETNIFLGGAIVGTKQNSYRQHLGVADQDSRICKMLAIQHMIMVDKLRKGEFATTKLTPAKNIPKEKNTLAPVKCIKNSDIDAVWDRLVAKASEEKNKQDNDTSQEESTPHFSPVTTPALSSFNDSIKNENPHQRALTEFERGMELIQHKQYKAALEAWREALRMDPDTRKYQVNFKRLSQKIADSEGSKTA